MPKKNWIDARWNLGFGKYKSFIVFIVGPDRRNEDDLKYSNQRNAVKATVAKTIVYSGILFWVVLSSLTLMFVALYLLKSYAGIDLVQGSSPFPQFLKKIGICH